MSTLLNMREMQIKTSTSYQLTFLQADTLQTINAAEGVEKRESSYNDAENGKWEHPPWRTLGRRK